MNRNFLYVLLGAAIIAIGALAYSLHQEQQKSGLNISVGGKDGLKIEGK